MDRRPPNRLGLLAPLVLLADLRLLLGREVVDDVERLACGAAVSRDAAVVMHREAPPRGRLHER